ncbi:MAG: glycosyltransferase [Candidatus Abyssobacteria bacterium SURF_17]|jgi:GT2 family glycosyltransferase|uniref:Glycosyltransferase n=1 Tax=Candidatus Abyssobacteria bacterium SURF_17 TaxID=2093361 RepID=A0A419EW08_9BACT|nr:MAG: glycosyltransferase [Candidatus Abyssubacteria bacterium SURF_17]
MTNAMDFTIIVPVCHGGSFLNRALQSLQEIEYPSSSFEVVVAASAADGKSESTVRQHVAQTPFLISYVACIGMNRAGWLNAACAVARGDIWVFSDDDCVFRRDWLRKIKEVVEAAPNIGLVGGIDELTAVNSSFARALDFVLNSFFGTGGLRAGRKVLRNGYYPRLWNMALPHKVALDIALRARHGFPQIFDESLNVCEDLEIARRVRKSGEKVTFAPQVRVGHSRDTTFRSFVQRNLAMARTSRRLGLLRLPHAALSGLALCTLTLLAGSFFAYSARVALLIHLGAYSATLLAHAVMALVHTRSLRAAVMVPCLLAGLHFARGFGYFLPDRTADGTLKIRSQ